MHTRHLSRLFLCLLSSCCLAFITLSYNAVADSELEDDSSRVSESHDEKNDTSDEEYAFALLMNPADIIWKLVYKQIPLNPQFQVRITSYIALDVIPHYSCMFGKNNEGEWSAGGALGLRISPFGTGLQGFYVVPRVQVRYVKVISRNCGFSQFPLGVFPHLPVVSSCPAYVEEQQAFELLFVNTTLEGGYAWVWNHFDLNLGLALGWGRNVHEGVDIPVFLFNTSLGFAI